jgi:phosphoglycolate phosphatase-like HAD superfamily hydrolase
VLWNIDHTLVDVGRITRDAYAEAFHKVVGRQLLQLAPTAGRTESEIIFETLAVNDVTLADNHLPEFIAALEAAYASRHADLRAHGRILTGAREALTAVSRLPDVVQTVLTGSIKPNAIAKLNQLGLAEHIDFEVGGYGSETYPKGTLIEVARIRAAEKYGATFEPAGTVLIADSPRDVRAAEIGDASVIAVATGTATEAELRTAGAGEVLPTLANASVVVSAIDRLTR